MERSRRADGAARLARVIAMALISAAACFAFLIILQKLFVPFHIIASDAMAPLIKPGDAVVIMDLEAGNVKLGDVIVFHNPDIGDDFIISRVVDIEEGGSVRYFSTMGDNGDVPDPGRIPTGRVVGRIGIKAPGLGGFLEFLVSITGYVVCIGIPAAVGIVIISLLTVFESREYERSGRCGQSCPEAAARL